MWKRVFSEEEIDWIRSQLPDLRELQDKTLGLSPDLISIHFGYESLVPSAAACFKDLKETLFDVKYAMSECFAHGIYCRKHKDPPNEMEALGLENFYLQDAAMRLYSCGEHLANAIICMLDVSDKDLAPFRERRTSQSAIVGAFLSKERPQHPITDAVAKLAASPHWQDTMDYRGKVVHQQPPTVDGLGLAYTRGIRWEKTPDGKQRVLALVAGDTPDFKIEEIKAFVRPAFALFVDVSQTCIEQYHDILRAAGQSVAVRRRSEQ